MTAALRADVKAVLCTSLGSLSLSMSGEVGATQHTFALAPLHWTVSSCWTQRRIRNGAQACSTGHRGQTSGGEARCEGEEW